MTAPALALPEMRPCAALAREPAVARLVAAQRALLVLPHHQGRAHLGGRSAERDQLQPFGCDEHAGGHGVDAAKLQFRQQGGEVTAAIKQCGEVGAGLARLGGGKLQHPAIGARTPRLHRIFGLLPSDLSDDLRATWEEFERAETPDAIFAKSLDRVQPVVQNLACDGGTWVEYKVSYEQLVARVGQKVARGAPKLCDWISEQARAWFSKRKTSE